MLNTLSKFPEWKILAYLGIIALSYHLFTIFSSFVSFFADIFLLLILSWILAFLIEPLVTYFKKYGLSGTVSSITIYILLAIFALTFGAIIIPTVITQLSQLSSILPSYIPANSLLASRLENFVTATLSNYVNIASQLASILANLTLVFILSFYFLISRQEISKFILQLIPDKFEEDYRFLNNTLNTTFASFIRVQVLLGLILGFLTFISMFILKIEFAMSTAIISALLAMIPVVGPILFLIPPVIAAAIVSPQKLIILFIVLILSAQLIYNLFSPRLLGKALKIHPIVVLIAFLIGYKIGGIWGSIFAVPITSAFAIMARDFLKYWKNEADK